MLRNYLFFNSNENVVKWLSFVEEKETKKKIGQNMPFSFSLMFKKILIVLQCKIDMCSFVLRCR